MKETHFSNLDLHESIQNKLTEKQFVEMTPIQTSTIPLMLKKKDVIACAKTGSGKTLAFVLPILNSLMNRQLNQQEKCRPKEIHALILVPTRELAIQICEEASYFARDLPLKIANVYGGQDHEKQRKNIQGGVDFLVATPGRLKDFYKSKDLILEKTEYVVLDEADRMLDMGFIDDMKYILNQIKSIQNISLWSATIDYNVFYSIWNYMNDPEEILINHEWIDKTKITQYVLHLGSDEKLSYTLEYCRRLKDSCLVIFSNTKNMVRILTDAFNQYGLPAEGLSSVIHQKKRLKVLDEFKKGKFQVLVATDLASRGIHVDDITQVINYDIPNDPESYVHRIGRTARAGNKGVSLSICCERDYEALEKIENYLSYKIPIMEPVEEIIRDIDLIKAQSKKNRRSKFNFNGSANYSRSNKRLHHKKTKSSSYSNRRQDIYTRKGETSNDDTYSKRKASHRVRGNTHNTNSKKQEVFIDEYPASHSNQLLTKPSFKSRVKKLFGKV